MEDKEFDLCNKKCKSFLKRDKYGKGVVDEIMQCLKCKKREVLTKQSFEEKELESAYELDKLVSGITHKTGENKK